MVSFFIHMPFIIFRSKMAKNKGLQFSAQGTHHGRLLKNRHKTNLGEVAVGTDPNID